MSTHAVSHGRHRNRRGRETSIQWRAFRVLAAESLCLLATVVLGALAAAAVVMTLLILWWLAWQLALAAVLLAVLGVAEWQLIVRLWRLERAVDEEAQR